MTDALLFADCDSDGTVERSPRNPGMMFAGRPPRNIRKSGGIRMMRMVSFGSFACAAQQIRPGGTSPV